MKIKNNINKNIGKVVYIVEGDNDEPKLIIDIFQKSIPRILAISIQDFF